MNDPQRIVSGLAFAAGAYTLWGLSVLYFKALGHVPALEVLAYRTVWSLPLVLAVIVLMGKTGDLWVSLRRPRTLALLFASTLLLTANWGLFIWAIQAERVLEVSLGYYINPLVNVAFGVALLGERLSRAKAAAIALAAAGVAAQAASLGALPLVSVFLALSFSLYGLIRKTVQADAITGLGVEMALIFPFGVLGLWALTVWSAPLSGAAAAEPWLDPAMTGPLLGLAGVMTVAPLALFALGARRLHYTTVGLIQYIAPSLQLLIGVSFGEEFTRAHALSFGLIWGALALYAADSLLTQRRMRLAQRPSA